MAAKVSPSKEFSKSFVRLQGFLIMLLVRILQAWPMRVLKQSAIYFTEQKTYFTE